MSNFSDKMRLKEKAAEDIYFARRDEELIRAMHERDEQEAAAATAGSPPGVQPGGGDSLPVVRVFGGDHSPWVQAVLLGLHAAGRPYRLEYLPPLKVFLHSGVLMPAACLEGNEWTFLSARILPALGYEPVSREDRRALFQAWRGVQHRADSIGRFWYAWSLCRDGHPAWPVRIKNHLLRPIVALYFLVLLRLAGKRLASPETDEPWQQFAGWEDRLAQGPGPFLAGDAPNSVDFSLFGVIQCHASIPVPPLETLRDSPRLPRLRAWISAMQAHFSDYPHLYSGQYFSPSAPPPRRSGTAERGVFWLGSALALAALPLTLPLTLYYIRRVRRLRLAG